MKDKEIKEFEQRETIRIAIVVAFWPFLEWGCYCLAEVVRAVNISASAHKACSIMDTKELFQ